MIAFGSGVLKLLHKKRKIIRSEKRCRDGMTKITQTREDIKVKVNIQSLEHM